jgi:hypothetical protein
MQGKLAIAGEGFYEAAGPSDEALSGAKENCRGTAPIWIR